MCIFQVHNLTQLYFLSLASQPGYFLVNFYFSISIVYIKKGTFLTLKQFELKFRITMTTSLKLYFKRLEISHKKLDTFPNDRE